ncbi:MAG: hypothetical protein ACTSX9_00085 [Candidatus Njordarchaeales archaeon]
MSTISKVLKAIVLILSILLSVFSAVIGYDAYRLANYGIYIGETTSVQGEEYVNITVPIVIKNVGYFFDLSNINITVILFDNYNRSHARDTEIIDYIPLKGEKNITIELSIPLSVGMQWMNGTIELYIKFIIRFWFSKYGFAFVGFGIAGVSVLERR